MPTYEYLCQKCNNRLEVWQKMTDEPLTICTECGGHIRRVYHPAGIVFKGSGFYKTDHRSDSSASSGSNGRNGHDHATKGEGESKATEGKSSGESKPAESGSSSSENKAGTTAGTK